MERKCFKIKACDIALLQFILESYEGLVTVSTIDPRDAIIQISIMPDFAEDVESILEDLKERFMIKVIPSQNIRVNSC